MILSPKQLYKTFEEINSPYECPLCGQPGKTPEERVFIKDTGYCYSCEKVEAEMQQEHIEMAKMDAQDQLSEINND